MIAQELKVELIEKEILAIELKTIDIVRQLPDVLNNYNATIAPTATDDSVSGYAVGSTWIDIVADKSYICVDATATAAVWNSVEQDKVDPATIDHNLLKNYEANRHKEIIYDSDCKCFDVNN